MLAQVLAWVVDVNLLGDTHVFQLGKDRCRLPNQNRPNSRFLHERASRSQNSPISSICQYNAHWVRKCARMEPSDMAPTMNRGATVLSLFFYHGSSSPLVNSACLVSREILEGRSQTRAISRLASSLNPAWRELFRYLSRAASGQYHSNKDNLRSS